METMSLPVGPGQPNLPADVKLLQGLLDRNFSRVGMIVPIDGKFDRSTESAVMNFQRRVMRAAFPSGVVAPDDATFLELTLSSSLRTMAASAGRLRLPLGDTNTVPLARGVCQSGGRSWMRSSNHQNSADDGSS